MAYKRIALTSGVLLALALSIVLGAGAASGQSPLARIGAAPSLPANAVNLGRAPAAASVSGTIVLRPRDEQA